MKELNKIKNEIHTTNPQFSDDLLNLLYEFILIKLKNDYSYTKLASQILNDDFQTEINNLIKNQSVNNL